MDVSPYTLSRAYTDIRSGTQPWVALNEFLHAWLAEASEKREALMAEPVGAPDDAADHGLWKWAVVCAALAECLCQQAGITCPSWVHEAVYTLPDPWYAFDAPGAAKLAVREYLERTTPEPFRRRNILSGNRVFANKYTFAASSLAERGLDAHRLP